MIIPWKRVEIAAALLVVVGSVVGVRAWIRQHDAAIRAEEQTRSKDELVQALAVQQKARDTQLAQTVSRATETKKRVQTPAQVVKAAPKLLDLPQPVAIMLPDKLDEPAIVSVPQVDLKPAFDALVDCQTCKTERDTLRADLTDERAKTKVLTDEVVTWKKTANGGSFWLRLGRATKIVVFTVAVTAGAMCATGHCK